MTKQKKGRLTNIKKSDQVTKRDRRRDTTTSDKIQATALKEILPSEMLHVSYRGFDRKPYLQ